jgi:hypothetical protein
LETLGFIFWLKSTRNMLLWGADYEKPMRTDISTVVLNYLHTEFGMAPAAEGGKAKCSTAAFPKLFTFSEVRSQVSLVTVSHPSPITVAPPPCLPLDIKVSLKEDGRFLDGGLIGE